jgi:hypothetical protein
VLQKDLDQRYASARLLERDLKALLARQGYEPTEHDLAEYVNTLLKGTREESESLLSTRFALPAEPPAPRPEPRPQVPPAPTGPIPPEDEPTLSGLEPAPPIPAAPPAAATQRKAAPGKTKPWKAKPGRGRLRPWLLAILGLLAIAAAWAYRGSFAK